MRTLEYVLVSLLALAIAAMGAAAVAGAIVRPFHEMAAQIDEPGS